MIKATPLETLKSYLRWQIRAAAPMLSKPFVDEDFAFYGQTLQGAKELEPAGAAASRPMRRWARRSAGLCRQDVRAGGQGTHGRLVGDLRAAYAKDLKTLPWMGEETSGRPREAQVMVDKIGYPAKWRDYSALEVKRDAPSNVPATDFETRRELAKIGKPVDRGEWGMSPPTVNAYYSPLHNDINFPAGILQPPFFDA